MSNATNEMKTFTERNRKLNKPVHVQVKLPPYHRDHHHDDGDEEEEEYQYNSTEHDGNNNNYLHHSSYVRLPRCSASGGYADAFPAMMMSTSPTPLLSPLTPTPTPTPTPSSTPIPFMYSGRAAAGGNGLRSSSRSKKMSFMKGTTATGPISGANDASDGLTLDAAQERHINVVKITLTVLLLIQLVLLVAVAILLLSKGEAVNKIVNQNEDILARLDQYRAIEYAPVPLPTTSESPNFSSDPANVKLDPIHPPTVRPHSAHEYRKDDENNDDDDDDDGREVRAVLTVHVVGGLLVVELLITCVVLVAAWCEHYCLLISYTIASVVLNLCLLFQHAGHPVELAVLLFSIGLTVLAYYLAYSLRERDKRASKRDFYMATVAAASPSPLPISSSASSSFVVSASSPPRSPSPSPALHVVTRLQNSSSQ